MDEAARQALSQTNFAALDWAIVGAYLVVSLVIGILVKQFATGMVNYIAAGRSVGVWLGIATMTGTELGLVTVMYSAEQGFTGGPAAFHIAMIAGAVALFVGITGLIVADLRRLEVITIPEFYERRFGRDVRILGGITLAFAGILNMGLFLKVGSMFLVGLTGMSATGYALPLVMTLLLGLVLVYTVLGGMISVIVTDYVQFVVLSIGLLFTTVLAIWRLGWNNIFEVIKQNMGPLGFDPLVAEGTFGPEYVLWMAVLGLVGCAIWPTAVARALAMESTTAVKRQFMWSSVAFVVRFLVPNFFGICAFVYIVQHAPDLAELFPFNPQELRSGAKPMSPLYAMPVFLGRVVPSGLIGIIAAAMIAAFMSTHDSYLLCWSSVITQDIVAPLSGRPITARQRILWTRCLIVLIGGFLLGWGLFYTGSEAVWGYMAITGAIYFSGAMPLLIGGLYWRRASRVGALASLCFGFLAVLGLEPIRKVLGLQLLALLGRSADVADALKLLSGARVGLTVVAMTTLAFIAGSLLSPDPPREADAGDMKFDSKQEPAA